MPDQWIIDMSRYQAYEVFGPGAEVWVTISSVATLLGLAMIILLTVRAFRHDGSTPVAIGFVVLATVAIMIDTNKTLSPQYLLWLGGPMATLLVFRRTTRRGPCDQTDSRTTSGPGSAHPTGLSPATPATSVATVTR